jgi:endo-chitodextinase
MNYNNISNQTISNATTALSLSGCKNIVIIGANISNVSGIYLYNCQNITITNCYIKGANKAINAQNCSNVNVITNSILNVISGAQTGNAVQFNNVQGGSIIGNKIQNNHNASSPEDVISLYQSNGTANSLILVSMNEIIGGGPSMSGGGIMLGDNGGSYQLAIGNILVNPGQYGISSSGGSNMGIINNQVYGVKQSFTNVGICLLSGVTLAIVANNNVNYTNSAGQINGYWNGSGTPAIGEATNNWDAAITANILPINIVT